MIREHEPLPIDATSPRWYGIRRAIRHAKRYGDCSYFCSSYDHYGKKAREVPSWLTDAGVRVVLIPAFAYKKNTSPIRFLNSLIFNTLCWIRVSFMKPAMIFVSGPTMGLFMLPVIRRSHKYHAELRDCWPLIAYQRDSSLLARFRFSCLALVARASYRGATRHCRIRCVSVGVFDYLSEIVPVNRLLYRPFVAEVGVSEPLPSWNDRSGAIFAGNFEKGFDLSSFEVLLRYVIRFTNNITVAGGGTSEAEVKRLCEAHGATYVGWVSHAEVRELMLRSRYLMCAYPRNVGFEYHRTNKIMEAERLGLVLISNIPLDTRAKLLNPA